MRAQFAYIDGMKEYFTATSPQRRAWLTIKRHAPALLLCGLVGLSASCTTANPSHRVSAPPPPTPTKSMTTTTTTTTPVVAPAVVAAHTTDSVTSTTTVITQVPPALKQEVPIAQPSSEHVWIAGYWTWQNERYEWMTGHWELPPNSNSTWVTPHWDKSGSAYRFYEGYWD